MHPPLSPEQWEGMRELRDLLPPNFPRIAKIANVHVTTVRERASRENWPKLHIPRGAIMRVVSQKELREGETIRSRVAALEGAQELAAMELATDVSPGDMAAELVDALRKILAGLRIGFVDKARIDGLLSVARLAERLDSLKLDADQQEQKRSDDELANILTRLDQRIVELARDCAERLVAKQFDA